VHGILANDISFAEPMQSALGKLLPAELHHFVNFQSVFWAGTVRDHQRNYMARARAAAGIKDNALRRFLIQGLGDAAAYQKTRYRRNSIYYEVQETIAKKIEALDMPGMEKRPLIFIGHSLGCHVISSFLWDFNRFKQRTDQEIAAEPDDDIKAQWRALQDATPFGRLDTLAGIVTMGSNMPMFTFTFGPDRVFPITVGPIDAKGRRLDPAFPGKALSPALLNHARWLNFFSKRDVLGFPLKALNEEYGRAERIHDIPVRSESVLSRCVMYLSSYAAHTGYWSNPTVLRETAKLIRDIVETPAEDAAPAPGIVPDSRPPRAVL